MKAGNLEVTWPGGQWSHVHFQGQAGCAPAKKQRVSMLERVTPHILSKKSLCQNSPRQLSQWRASVRLKPALLLWSSLRGWGWSSHQEFSTGRPVTSLRVRHVLCPSASAMTHWLTAGQDSNFSAPCIFLRVLDALVFATCFTRCDR